MKITGFAQMSEEVINVVRKYRFDAPLSVTTNQNVIAFNSVKFLVSINWAVVQCSIVVLKIKKTNEKTPL